MNLLLPWLGTVVLVICVIGFVLWLRRRRAMGERDVGGAVETTPDVETQERDGAPEPAQPWYRRIGDRPILRNALLALLLLVVVASGWLIYDARTTRDADRFVLLIAPFDDGGNGATGRNVAEALARQITQDAPERLTVAVLDQQPTDAKAALALATAEGGDMLVWGSVDAGGMFDSASLRPRLIYTPDGPYAPNGWEGYSGRFAMPRSYTIATEPINGQAVLTPLLLALFDYGRGFPDLALGTLGRLIDDYPSLNAPLPHAIRGNVFWARGDYSEAVAEYRLALAQPSDEQAVLANNLGAVLLDSGDPGALDAFSEAVRLLEGRDLGELRFNLGMLALREQRPADAAVELEQARNLLPPTTPLLVALADAYRDTGRLDSAAAAIAAATARTRVDQSLVPQPYRLMINQRLDAALREQRGLLDLARAIDAQGPLAWELEVAAVQSSNEITRLRDQLRIAADTSQLEVAKWRQRSASDGASYAGSGQVAGGQAERAELQTRRHLYYLALLDAELARSRTSSPSSAFGQLGDALFAGQTPLGAGLAILEDLDKRTPNSPPVLLATARALRIGGRVNDADRTYDQVVQSAPQLPEGYFGKGVIALDRGDRDSAIQLFTMAIERNGAFFPARIELAAIAESRGDWATAIDQLSALANQRPGPRSAVALGQVLRRSGPQNYITAEQVLVPASSSSADASIELGRLYNDAGRSDEAIKAYRAALVIDPTSSTAAFELGERLAVAGELAEAERSLRNAVRFDDTNTAARLALARLYQGPLNQPDRADREYGVALSQELRNPDDLLTIGDAALANRNPSQALNAYTKAAKLAPDNPRAQHKLALAYLATTRLQSANDSELRVLELTGNIDDPELRALRSEALASLGDIARQRGELPLATDYYNQAKQLDPQFIAADIGLGQVAVGLGQWGVALGYFESAVALPGANDSAPAQFWLAEGLLRSGDFARATAAYGRALELQPSFPEALLGLAQVQNVQGNPLAALETVNRSLEQRPEYAEGLLFKGKLLQEQTRFDEAMTAYNASVRANSNISESHYRRGVLFIRNEQYDNAVGDLRDAIELQPNFPEANYWLGRAYYAEGRMESARDAFKRATDLNAGYTEALYYYGLAAEDLGRRDEAISAYETVMVSDGSGEWGARARTQLARLQ